MVNRVKSRKNKKNGGILLGETVLFLSKLKLTVPKNYFIKIHDKIIVRFRLHLNQL